MHKRHHSVEVDVAQVPSGFTWFDPRDESLKEELITLFVSTHEQDAVKVHEDTHPTDRNGAPYDWSARRTEVIERAGKNIKDWVQPLGYVEAVTQSQTEAILMSVEARAAEIAYLASTQEQELAPQWLELRENGITAIPFQMKWADEEVSFGETVSEEQAHEMLIDYTMMGIKDGNRIEEFLRESDYAYAQHGIVNRYKWVEKDGKRGMKPDITTPKMLEQAKATLLAAIAAEMAPSAEEIKTLAELHTEFAQRRAFYGKDWRFSLLQPAEWDAVKAERHAAKYLDALDPDRHEVALLSEAEEYERHRPKSGIPCPAPDCATEGDDCRICLGRTTVMSAIGFSDDIWEGIEYAPDDELPTFEDSLYELDFESITK